MACVRLSILHCPISTLQAHGGGAIPRLAFESERFVAVSSEPLSWTYPNGNNPGVLGSLGLGALAQLRRVRGVYTRPSIDRALL